jgi:serine phosphatase RsbU (regulator of sigma subunit)
MAVHETIPAADTPRDAYRLRAHEIWGGNDGATDHIVVPGFEAYVYCMPHEGETGGDLRFVSTCAAGQIVRFTLADISGHGPGASEAATRLRALIRKHINTPNPAKFARALNWEFTRQAEAGGFATAIITTYFAPTDHLIVCNAGHPRPFLYHAFERRWEFFDEQSGSALPASRAKETGIANLPLGIIGPTDYPMSATHLEPGDIYVAYTDGFIEEPGEDAKPLGEQGLLDFVQSLDPESPDRIGPAVIDAHAARRAGRPAGDDLTILVLSHSATDPPGGAWARIQALGRLVGLID